jgi:hypothetical protein
MKTSEFNVLSKAEKRIAIAKDALAQIKQKKILPTTGFYLNIPGQWDNENSLQKEIKKKDFYCHCCAKGALFVSCVKQVNEVRMFEDWEDERFQKDKLKDYFSVLQLDMIEAAFEGMVIADSAKKLEYYEKYTKNTPLGLKCIKFTQGLNAEERMEKILNNIIKNNGYFRP